MNSLSVLVSLCGKQLHVCGLLWRILSSGLHVDVPSCTFTAPKLSLLPVLLKLAVFTPIDICLNIANGSRYAKESSAIHTRRSQYQLQAKNLESKGSLKIIWFPTWSRLRLLFEMFLYEVHNFWPRNQETQRKKCSAKSHSPNGICLERAKLFLIKTNLLS